MRSTAFPKAFFSIGKKGFNLFTALISFLLILLAVLLVHSMVQSESNAMQTIDQIQSRSMLETTAEMARADAMQVFNYALRKKIEEWLVDEETGVVQLDLQHKTWDEIQQEFARSKFSSSTGSQFAFYASRSLEAFFSSKMVYFGNYEVDIENEQNLERSIRNAINVSTEDFFTVVECPDGDPRECKKGTFYVNLHLENLPQEQYEEFPLIRVTDTTTGEEIKEFILPKTTFRIFVPIRFFKAIAEARALTHYPEGGAGNYDSMGWLDTSRDAGLFSPKNHNEIEKMGLGMCDYGICRPRENPLERQTVASLNGESLFCPGDTTASKYQSPLTIGIKYTQGWAVGAFLPQTYNANNYNNNWTEMSNALSQIAEAKVCSVLKDAESAGFIDSIKNDKFSLVGNECGEEKKLAYKITVNADARDSKALVLGNVAGIEGIDPGRNLGLYADGKGGVDFPHIGIADLDCDGIAAAMTKSRCSEVKSIEVILAFKEEDTNYMVRQTKPGEERFYRIAVYDNTYVPFTANWAQGEMGANYLYATAPQETHCSAAQGWLCSSIRVPADMPDSPETAGCRPAGS